MHNPLEHLSFDETEYERNESLIKKRPLRTDLDRRICACGHPMNRHKPNPYIRDLPGVSEAYHCSPAKTPCSCKVPRPVLQVFNTKRFLMKPLKHGGPSGHPLTRGLAKVKKDHPEELAEIEWLIPIKCDKCEREDIVVTPIGFDIRQRQFLNENQAGDRTYLLCDDCRYPTSEQPVVDSEGND